MLLTATLLNYANRVVVTQNAVPLQEALHTDAAGYGEAAGRFAIGFALGGLLFGILADWISVRWLYPTVVAVWSLAGCMSGAAESLGAFVGWQFVLGLFEAGHWPCSLRTTQRVFLPHERTWANSVLQSGASLGAVLTPLLVAGLLRWDPGRWQWAFFLVGGLGLPWVVWWLLTVREADVRRPVIQTDEVGRGPGAERPLVEMPFHRVFLSRRWWLLLCMVVCINTLWHFIRVWLPLLLETDHGYTREFVIYFTSLYYLATFFGSLAAGGLAAWLPRRGWNVHRARLGVFLLFAVLSTGSIPAAFLPRGPWLLGTLLVVAFGSLGLFPVYYSLNQEISAQNQGKVGGSLGLCTWVVLFFLHPAIGRLLEFTPTLGELTSRYRWLRQSGLGDLLVRCLGVETPTRSVLFAAVGLGPLFAFAVLALFWGRRGDAAPSISAGEQSRGS